MKLVMSKQGDSFGNHLYTCSMCDFERVEIIILGSRNVPHV